MSISQPIPSEEPGARKAATRQRRVERGWWKFVMSASTPLKE